MLLRGTVNETDAGLPTWSGGSEHKPRCRTVDSYSPRPKRIDITSAWGNRTFTPYTNPLRAPLGIDGGFAWERKEASYLENGEVRLVGGIRDNILER